MREGVPRGDDTQLFLLLVLNTLAFRLLASHILWSHVGGEMAPHALFSLQEVDYWAHCWLPARDVVVKAIEGRNSVHSSGSIIKLEVNLILLAGWDACRQLAS